MLASLVLLNFEVIRAYQAAIRKVADRLRPHMAALMAEHEEQATALAGRAQDLAARLPVSRDIRGEWAAEIDALGAEREVVARLARIEAEVASAYSEAARLSAAGAALSERLEELCVDERRHQSWLARYAASIPGEE
jgi:chromosome segregation ATPase